jgi:hypothetical protein
MGKIACICGNVISDVCWPGAYVGHLITSYSKDQEREEDMEVLECNHCGCLLIENPNNDREMIMFQPVDKKYHAILMDKFSL